MTVGKTLAPLFLAAAMLAGCAKPPYCCQEPPPPEPTKEAQALFNAMRDLANRAQAAGVDSYRLELAIMEAFNAANKDEPSCDKTAIEIAVRFYAGDEYTPTAGVFHGKAEKLLAGYCDKDKLQPEEINAGYRHAISVVQNLNP